jgi:hypothetical protein
MAGKYFANLGRRDFLLMLAGSVALLEGAASPLAVFAQTGGAQPLKIATLGAGRIGSTLGSIWVKAGHPVMFSSRHPEELKGLVEGLGSLAKAGSPAKAIEFASVLIREIGYEPVLVGPLAMGNHLLPGTPPCRRAYA